VGYLDRILVGRRTALGDAHAGNLKALRFTNAQFEKLNQARTTFRNTKIRYPMNQSSRRISLDFDGNKNRRDENGRMDETSPAHGAAAFQNDDDGGSTSGNDGGGETRMEAGVGSEWIRRREKTDRRGKSWTDLFLKEGLGQLLEGIQ
jgi:hypothetical protein